MTDLARLRALQRLLIALMAVGAVLHQVHFWNWYIEDAAISFAYARNLATGEGLVALPGGERLEGYSNPTWVFLLAVFEVLGFSSFDSSKVLQAVLAALTVPLTALLARECEPLVDEDRPTLTAIPVVAAGFLATSSTFAIWGASGLENALFSALLAAALWRSVVEFRTEGFPVSAFLWFLLAITRPEAILYAAVAGLITLLSTLRRPRHTLLWLLTFFLPFGIYHVLRFNYFAYEFPQTYYGKLGTRDPQPFHWDRRGWRYVRDWSHTLWTGYYLPLYVLGLSGRGWRAGLGLLVVLFTGSWVLLPELLPDGPVYIGSFSVEPWLRRSHLPTFWGDGRPQLLFAVMLLGPAIGLGRDRRVGARALCALMGTAILFFAVYSMGDWMKAWRWMSLLQVPLAVLFALGTGVLAERVEAGVARFEAWAPTGLAHRATWALLLLPTVLAAAFWGHRFALGIENLFALVLIVFGIALLAGWLGARTGRDWGAGSWTLSGLLLLVTTLPNLTHTRAQRGHPETDPFSIEKRVQFELDVKHTLDITDLLRVLDVDMGGHLWWGSKHIEVMDLAGLVDIPMAQHRFQRAFFEEYVFEEMRPDVAHVHGAWASHAAVNSYPQWRDGYYEIPGYPTGGLGRHPGNFVRRDRFLTTAATPHTLDLPFADGWVVERIEVPSEPGAGRLAWMKVAVRATLAPSGEELPVLQVFAKQDGMVKQIWTLPLAFDWLAEAGDWKTNEAFVGGFAVPVELPAGSYTLGVVLLRPDGQVIPAMQPAAEPVYVRGEAHLDGPLEVVEPDAASALAQEDRLAAIDLARKGHCETAEQRWDLARWHLAHNWSFYDQNRPAVAGNLSICWSHRAANMPAGDPAASWPLVRAAQWDRSQPHYLQTRASVGQTLYEHGMNAYVHDAWGDAYLLLSASVRADPTRSWARRYAELARAEKLGLNRPPPPKPGSRP